MIFKDHKAYDYHKIYGKELYPVATDNPVRVKNSCTHELNIRHHNSPVRHNRISCWGQYEMMSVNIKCCRECRYYIGDRMHCKKSYFIVNPVYADNCIDYTRITVV